MPALTSRIASCAAVASPGAFVSTICSTPPSGPRTTRPYPLGSSSSAVAIVAAAPLRSCSATSAAISSGVTSGTSPLSTTTGALA
jgi:hypothetical protein